MKVKVNLKRNKRILESLLELRRPHRRMGYCQAEVPRVAKWWVRRLRKREEKRKERYMAKLLSFVKKKKVTLRDVKQQRRKDVLAEMTKEITAKLPHFRMLYKSVNIEGPLPHQLQMRKHKKKRRMLAVLKQEQSLLMDQFNFLLSPSVIAESKSIVDIIDYLTRMKICWDEIFNDVKNKIKLLTTSIAENGTVLQNLNLKMSKNYFDRKSKEKNMITQPAYFGEVEYNLYPEKRIHTRKSIKERYLEDLAEIENLYMELDKKGEEVNHYLRTRELFVSVLDRILNKLNRGKRIVLDFLQDGHNIMNDLTMRFHDLTSMRSLSDTVGDRLEARRRQAENERALTVNRTRELLARHRPTRLATTYRDVRSVVEEPSLSPAEVKSRLDSAHETLLKSALVMAGMTDLGAASLSDLAALSEDVWIPQVKQHKMSNAFLMRKIPFPLIQANSYKKKVEDLKKSILVKKQTRRDMRNKVKDQKRRYLPLLDAARDARMRVRKEYVTLYQTLRCFVKPLRDLYGLLNKKSNYNAHKLGIHNRMTEYNKIECLNHLRDTIPYNVAKLVYAEKTSDPKDRPYNTIIRSIDKERMKWKRYQLIRQLVRPQTPHLRKKKSFEIVEHPPLHKSPCPLCCVEERLSKMAVVEQFEDHIRSVYEIRCELRDSQELADLRELNHPIWECSQPAARSLIQLLILEDRTKQPGAIMDFTKVAN